MNLLGLNELEKDVRKWLGRRGPQEQATAGAIVMRDGELVEIIDKAQKALLAARVPIYQRGGELVRATTNPIGN